jgi:hypothetical protein
MEPNPKQWVFGETDCSQCHSKRPNEREQGYRMHSVESETDPASGRERTYLPNIPISDCDAFDAFREPSRYTKQ